MGLIKAIVGATGGVLADQWKEYFYCDALPANVICKRGQKKTSGRSSNTKGDENIITQGSVIAVADGQCMLIVDQGKVVDVCAEPGEYKYDSSTEPSVFAGGFGNGLIESFKNIGKRFTFGGEAPRTQKVYYINTKEIMGNKYGTPQTVPFRVVDPRAGIDIDVSVSCFGEYSYKVVDPVVFYTNVCGNVDDEFLRENLEGQLRSELLTALQPAFARISEMGIRYSSLPGHTTELADALRIELTQKWTERRGIQIQVVGVSSVKATEEDEKMLKGLQRDAAFMDPTRAAAHLVGAQAEAMKTAAGNTNGAAMAFMGMGMAQQAGGASAQNLYQMGGTAGSAQAAQPVQPAATSASAQWTCKCGTVNTGKFCSECGNPRPAPAQWTCSCGAVNTGKFCSECGKPYGAGN